MKPNLDYGAPVDADFVPDANYAIPLILIFFDNNSNRTGRRPTSSPSMSIKTSSSDSRVRLRAWKAWTLGCPAKVPLYKRRVLVKTSIRDTSPTTTTSSNPVIHPGRGGHPHAAPEILPIGNDDGTDLGLERRPVVQADPNALIPILEKGNQKPSKETELTPPVLAVTVHIADQVPAEADIRNVQEVPPAGIAVQIEKAGQSHIDLPKNISASLPRRGGQGMGDAERPDQVGPGAVGQDGQGRRLKLRMTQQAVDHLVDRAVAPMHRYRGVALLNRPVGQFRGLIRAGGGPERKGRKEATKERFILRPVPPGPAVGADRIDDYDPGGPVFEGLCAVWS